EVRPEGVHRVLLDLLPRPGLARPLHRVLAVALQNLLVRLAAPRVALEEERQTWGRFLRREAPLRSDLRVNENQPTARLRTSLVGLGTRRRPRRRDVALVPLVPRRLQLLHLVRLRDGEVLAFADVVLEVEQLLASGPRRLDQLPVAGADGHLLAEPPEQGL